ncbi:leucine-rich repeat domain-containing protein [Saccharibacillus alkalitolerans]|uniref:Leucine-rich repeat domain-containing protein n=1 Tax=Saccharibacillus alkalitolerans TaxID=2705290 RepID=A0ABX0F6R4_9BACL|nr:leucine-rich repeat domain-containing protein [Saccharibacillus alkalitolerans]NGZ76657.1 leucine-rich repeat domain-containing protein [Saccharibacillus alkalitolerans]
MNIYNNPSGDAYYRLIDYAMERCETFSLTDARVPEGEEFDIPPYFPLRIVEELKPYLVREKWAESGIGTGQRFYPYDSPVYVWKCCPEAAMIVKAHTDNLQGWGGEGMPEDLCFQNADGKNWLWTVTHEGIRELNAAAEEAETLKDELRGVMLVDPKSPPTPKELVELAEYHGSDRLNLWGAGTAEVLPRLCELPELRIVELFDAHIAALPDSLFDLPLLEELTVYTGNLHGIPAAVGRAKNLKRLNITNGSHPEPHTEPGWKAPAKEELKLTKLPPEIGQLADLRVLDVTYSGLTELPDELANLKKLEYLVLVNHRIEGRPAVLKKLRHARNISFRRDGFF